MRVANNEYIEKNLPTGFVLKIVCSILLLFAIEMPINASLFITKTVSVLRATKGKKTYTYKNGKYLLIKYGAAGRTVSGILLGVCNDSIELVINDKKMITEKIAIAKISSISILYKKVRKQSLLNFLLCITVIPFLFNLTGGIYFTGLWWISYLFFLYLGTLALGFTYIGSYLLEKYSKKTTEKGWRFDSMETKEK